MTELAPVVLAAGVDAGFRGNGGELRNDGSQECGEKWQVAVDTYQDGETGPEVHAEDSVHLEPRSTLVLIRQCSY